MIKHKDGWYWAQVQSIEEPEVVYVSCDRAIEVLCSEATDSPEDYVIVERIAKPGTLEALVLMVQGEWPWYLTDEQCVFIENVLKSNDYDAGGERLP